MKDTIVAEVSMRWPRPENSKGTLSSYFEEVIAVNEKRGYALSDWKMSSVLVPANPPLHCAEITETIVAVFRRKPDPQAHVNSDP